MCTGFEHSFQHFIVEIFAISVETAWMNHHVIETYSLYKETSNPIKSTKYGSNGRKAYQVFNNFNKYIINNKGGVFIHMV